MERRLKLEIGSRLKRLRTERNLTQKELAVLVSGGLDYTYIGKIERGEQLPSLKILLKISEALTVPVASFFQEESAAAVTDISQPELRHLLTGDAGRQLLRALKHLDRDDFPLLIEIVQVLGRHRKNTRENSGGDALLAAEPTLSYEKKKE